MTRAYLFMSAALILSACGSPDSEISATETPDATVVTAPTEIPPVPEFAAAEAFDADGAVLILVDRVVSEPDACLLMMSVVNGTDNRVTAGLFAFDVTGNGQSAGANMFPQTTEAGDVKTAQIVMPGADCANAQVIEGGQLNCRIADTGESCVEVTELRDGVVEFRTDD